MTQIQSNLLYYGDNLPILRNRQHFPDGSVDLIYLDPPFNSNQSYNILFKESSSKGSQAQIEAFGDTWHWGDSAQQAYEEVVVQDEKAGRLLTAMIAAIKRNDVTAYLAMMAVRLLELRRILKDEGFIYLHCDPTAGPYLRVLMDSVFRPTNFRSEIVWRRSNAHSKLSRQYGPIHDTILFYSKSEDSRFLPGRRPHYRRYVDEAFKQSDDKGPFRLNEITGSGTRTGESGQPWHGIDITKLGRHWAIPGALTNELGLEEMSQHEKLDVLAELGDIVFSDTGFPRYKQRATKGVPFQDIWAYQPYTDGLLVGTTDGVDRDVKWLEDEEERLGYPTQKPLGLLERIIESTCAPGAVVLDPFCGCGTAVHASQKLGRRWIGIDITHLAIGLIRRRMEAAFSDLSVDVVGEPVDHEGAKTLAASDAYQFQWWALDKIGAQPIGDRKKGMDRGIDGVIPFIEGKSEMKRVIISIKGGATGPDHVRDLKGVLDREGEPIGVLVSLRKPTKEMQTEAASAGHYESPFWKKKYARIQLLTIEEVLAGVVVSMPPQLSPFAKPKAEKIEKGEQRDFGL